MHDLEDLFMITARSGACQRQHLELMMK
jgi:hypothetical protein